MTNELTDDDAQKLFQEVSQSIRNNETLKLDELVDVKPVEGNPDDEVATPAEEDQPDGLDTQQETPDSDTPGTEETAPPTESVAEEDSADAGDKPVVPNNLKDELELLKKENHHLKSQVGRMPHLQSRVKELDKKLEELRTQLSSPSSQPSAKIRPEIQKKLAKLKQTDAELAEILEESLMSATDGVAREQITAEIARTEALRNAEYDAYHKAEWDKLVEAVPNAKEVFTNPHWTTWKSKQSRAVQELAGSDSAEDVIFAINKYASDMMAAHPELAAAKETQAVATPSDPAAAEKAKQVEAARQQTKQKAVVTASPSAAAQVSTPSDLESLFKKYSEEIRKERLG